jgi:oligopeptide transport system ATP-binding protein
LETPSSIPLLEVKGLTKWFPLKRGVLSPKRQIRAVDGVSFAIQPGETFGLVGESGCGKTTTGRLILRLIEASFGSITFMGDNVLGLNRSRLKEFRRNTQIIFQDPFTSLDPRMTVKDLLEEPFKIHGVSRRGRTGEIEKLLEVVGLAPQYLSHYPHEFSGGQRQRIGIARALALKPKFIVCDEPVSALDVSIQSQILNLLSDLQQSYGIAYLFISHNLNVVNHISHRVAVMYLGRIVEIAPSDELYRNPAHPYTRLLLASIPVPDPEVEDLKELSALEIESVADDNRGCRFCARCPERADRICDSDEPRLTEISTGHMVACHAQAGNLSMRGMSCSIS